MAVEQREHEAREHVCFGCQKQIADHEPHIHIGLDEWAGREGIGGEPLGLDDLFTFAFCEACTQKTDRGWQLEAHEIEGAS
jgi:hypothetical protein